MSAAIERLLREVMPRSLQKVALQEAMSLHGELGIDSLGLMSLAFRLEEEFRLDLTQHAERVANLQTLGDLHRLVRELEPKDTP